MRNAAEEIAVRRFLIELATLHESSLEMILDLSGALGALASLVEQLNHKVSVLEAHLDAKADK